ncbi:hypothetical protein ACJMK2_037896 [Sinanodonta woodiana]|uniref:Claspin n=1 Tax=Sinanodonta woodiana TaxID=1069815 RepID=A0ABD3WMA2_SINWO
MQPIVGEEENILQEADKGVENNEKADSGMDEDVRSTRSPDTGENIDSDEEVIRRRPKKKVHHILDDDSDGSRDAISTEKHDENKSKTKTKFTTEEVLDAILEAKSEDVQFSPQRSRRRSKIMPVLEDSSDESDDDKINLSSLKETRANKLNDLFDAEESDEDEVKDAVQKDIDDTEENSAEREDKPVSLKGDLFDADSSSDEDSRSSGNSCRLGMLDDNDDDDDDEGFDESAISPHLLAKLKQGAAKKDKRPKRKSALRAEAMNIHSETQRLIRESQVVLPYHQPAPRPLQDFLARANRKQQEYRALRGARDFVKAKVLEEVLAKNRLSSKPSPVLNKHTLQTDRTSSENAEKLEVDLSSDKFKAHSLHDNNHQSGSDITDTRIDNSICSDNTSGGGGGASNNAGASSDSMDGVVSGDQLQNGDMNDTLPDIHVACSVSNSRRVDIRTKPMDGLSSTDISELQHDSIYSGHETFKSFTDKRIFDGNKNCAKASDPMSCSISNLNIEQDQGNDEVRTDSENIIHVKNKEGPVIPLEVSNNHLLNSDSNQLNLSEKTAINQSTFLTPKIAALVSLDLKVTPQLSGNFDSYINLDGEKEKSTPVNPGVAKLMSRLFQHSTKKEKQRHKDVDISIIQKEKTVDQKDELTLNTFTYHVDEVEENPLIKLDTPGAKLMVLKDQLQVKMKQRREEARQKRQELYDIDNEEGYEGEKEEEEEAEMTDESDTDVDDDEYDDKFGEEEEMQEDEAEEKNPFADDEAEEDNEADIEDEDDMELKLDVDDEDEDNDKDSPEASDEELRNSEDEGPIKRSSTGKKKSIALCISDEEDEAKDILTEDTFKAPTEKHEDRHFPVGGNHAIFGSAENSTQLPSGQRSFRLSMPIEDSQDLYGGSLQLLEPTQTQKTQDTDQGFKFFLDDSQSQLDSEGFLKSRSTVKKPVKSLMDDFNNTQDNMEQLLGLCSGQFAATQSDENKKSSRKSLFEESSEKALDGNMDELLGLCSGVFTNSNSQIESSQKKGVKRKATRAEEEDMECKNSFALISDNEQASDNEEEGFSDENEAQEESDGEGLDSGMDEVDGEIVRKEEQSNGVKQLKEQKFHGFTYGKQHGKIRKEFLEMEAELSGSEYDSDENLDLAEEDDILELEEGDKDVEAMDEDAIRNQVGRVHLKQLIDDDKRELMKFQEMYLPDGDLYSEGGGRLRRFRWSNMDDDTQQDMFGGESDEENLEEDNENEFKWRKERFEREKFLLEQQEKEQDKDENNPFLKLGQVFLKKKGSLDGSVGKADPKMQSASSDRKPPGTPTSLLKLENQKKGSFLSRSKQSLAKIAEMTKPSSNNLTGPKNSRNFVFQVISSDKEEQKPKKPAPAAQKKPSQISRQPEVKRPKLETQKSFSQTPPILLNLSRSETLGSDRLEAALTGSHIWAEYSQEHSTG